MGAVGTNWYLKYKKRIEFLEDKNRKLSIRNLFLERKIKKYENNNTGTTGDRENNNVVKLGGRIYKTGN
jgi:cell division protein FtsB